MDHLGLGVTDLDAWVEKLRREDIPFLEEPYALGSTRAVLIAGPSREALELVEIRLRRVQKRRGGNSLESVLQPKTRINVTAIHFVERTDNVRKTDRTRNEWESGCWPVPEETAQKLIGGTIYLHRSKQQPSHFGGEILSYRVEQSDTQAPCVVFTLRADADCKGVKTDRKGWSKDLKIFWDAAEPVQA